MAGTINKVILIGNLGKDPEVRVLESGAKMVRFPIATSEEYTDKTTGERKSITEWHNVVMWRGLAEVAERYLSKGQKVYIEGKIRTRTWVDGEKNTRYSTSIICDNMTMLSKKETNPTNTTPDFNKGSNFPNSSKDIKLEEDEGDELPF